MSTDFFALSRQLADAAEHLHIGERLAREAIRRATREAAVIDPLERRFGRTLCISAELHLRAALAGALDVIDAIPRGEPVSRPYLELFERADRLRDLAVQSLEQRDWYHRGPLMTWESL